MVEDRILGTKTDTIFELDKKIRFLAILTSDGEVVAEVFRRGVSSLEPESETKMVYTKAVIALGMTGPMDKYHGRVRSVVLNREKVTVICFNHGHKLVLVSAEPGFQKIDELGRLIERVGII